MILGLYFLTVVVSIAQAALLMSEVYKVARECIQHPEVNGTQDDVDDILMGYLPDTKSGMCMLRCMETRAGILVNDVYDLKGAFLFLRASFPENPFSNNMERGVRFCGKLVEKRKKPDMHPCQYAHMVAACIKRRIKYVPGCKAAFYNPFKWKNPSKKGTMKPVKKYFEVQQKYLTRHEFEIVTKTPKKYTLDDIKGVLSSSESEEEKAPVWEPPRERKGKRKRVSLKDKKGKRKKGKKRKKDDKDDYSWDKSDKSRRHKPKMFRI